jgi:hypothetical protein
VNRLDATSGLKKSQPVAGGQNVDTTSCIHEVFDDSVATGAIPQAQSVNHEQASSAHSGSRYCKLDKINSKTEEKQPDREGKT